MDSVFFTIFRVVLKTTKEKKMNQGKGRCLAVLLAMLMMISLVASSAHAVTSTKPADFKDVAKTKWYYDYVMSLAEDRKSVV